MSAGGHIERRRVALALRWLCRHWTAAAVARRLEVSPATVRLYAATGEASPYLVRRWRGPGPGAAWCRNLARGHRLGAADAATVRAITEQLRRTP